MLINTVIVFIKDLLPIFILLCLLKVININVLISKKAFFSILLASIFGIVATFKLFPLMNELWGGIGIEVIQTIEILFVYIMLLFSYSNSAVDKHPRDIQLYFISLAIVIFMVLNASVFIIFLDSYITNIDSIKNTIAGLVIGLGICLSFSSLFLFLLFWLARKKYYLAIYSIWAFFLTGQVSQVINLMQQVDIIQGSEALWDSSIIVADKSEYGHLLNSLFGYEARPSFELIILYLGSLVVFYSYLFICKCHKSSENSNAEGKNYGL